jgi:hypothetical protein
VFYLEGSDERKFAVELSQAHLIRVMQELRDMMTQNNGGAANAAASAAAGSDDKDGSGAEKWRRKLKVFRHSVRGALVAMSDLPIGGPELGLSTGAQEEGEGGAGGDLFTGPTLRSDCCELVLALMSHMRGGGGQAGAGPPEEFENEIKCKTICTQLAQLLVCARGGRKSRDLHGAMRWQEYVESQQSNCALDYAQEQRLRAPPAAGSEQGVPTTDGDHRQGAFIPRQLAVRRAQMQHLFRLNLLSHRALRVMHEKYGGAAADPNHPIAVLLQRYTQLVQELILSSSDVYAKVRKSAQKVVTSAW